MNAGMPRAADPPLGSQMPNQLLFQRSARLQEQGAINRFVRHALVLAVRIGPLQPSGNLLRRPILHQFTRNEGAELVVKGQATDLWPQGRLPGLGVGFVSSVLRPPWRATSRLTVEPARLRCWAMTRTEQPLAIPREMSSRSAKVSARPERRRTGGAIPPWRANRKWITCLSLPSARPIAFNDCPVFQRLHISARWAEDSFHRLACAINTTFRAKIYSRWCCIDRLSWHRFPRTWPRAARDSRFEAAPVQSRSVGGTKKRVRCAIKRIRQAILG